MIFNHLELPRGQDIELIDPEGPDLEARIDVYILERELFLECTPQYEPLAFDYMENELARERQQERQELEKQRVLNNMVPNRIP